MKTLYGCEGCGTSYDVEAEARACEARGTYDQHLLRLSQIAPVGTIFGYDCGPGPRCRNVGPEDKGRLCGPHCGVGFIYVVQGFHRSSYDTNKHYAFLSMAVFRGNGCGDSFDFRQNDVTAAWGYDFFLGAEIPGSEKRDDSIVPGSCASMGRAVVALTAAGVEPLFWDGEKGSRDCINEFNRNKGVN